MAQKFGNTSVLKPYEDCGHNGKVITILKPPLLYHIKYSRAQKVFCSDVIDFTAVISINISFCQSTQSTCVDQQVIFVDYTQKLWSEESLPFWDLRQRYPLHPCKCKTIVYLSGSGADVYVYVTHKTYQRFSSSRRALIPLIYIVCCRSLQSFHRYDYILNTIITVTISQFYWTFQYVHTSNFNKQEQLQNSYDASNKRKEAIN